MAQKLTNSLFYLITLACALVCAAPEIAQAANPHKTKPVTDLPQWADFERRQEQNLSAVRLCEANSALCASEALSKWSSLLQSLQGQNRLRQMITVNRWFNRIPYKYDEYAYGRLDYWADTVQLISDKGDCEDYALAKYYTLRELGIDPDAMKIVVVYDSDKKVNHAVLLVTLDKSRYLLDNNTDSMDPDPLSYRYKTLYSFNEKTAWNSP